MIAKSSRFALIASLCAARSFSSHCAVVPSYPLPSSSIGARHSEPVLTASERAKARIDLLAYRIARDVARPVSPFALVLVRA